MDGSEEGAVFAGGETVPSDDGRRLLMVLRDGATRTGLLEVSPYEPADRQDLERFAGVVAEVLLSRELGTDTIALARRTRELTLSAEMQWALLPPQTLSTAAICATGVLRPAYRFGGDVFDYALDDVFQFGVFDCMGHGVQAALTSSLLTGAYRSARRRGLDIVAIARELDAAVAEHRPHSYATGVVGTLDPAGRALRWVSAGHPPPRVLRDGRLLPPESAGALPLGMCAALDEDAPVTSAEVGLLAGDVVVLHTDGVVDPRNGPDAPTEEELTAMIAARVREGLPLDEVARQAMRDVADRAAGDLVDDAALVLISLPAQV